jgi:hypothetical protein
MVVQETSNSENSNLGLEFVDARICVEQIIDDHDKLHYLGVPIRDNSFMFGDNKSVLDNSMQFNAKLHKRHTMLPFICVRGDIVAGIVPFISYQEMTFQPTY